MMIGMIAAAVEELGANAGLQLPGAESGYGSTRIPTGTLTYPREAVDSDNFHVILPRPAQRIVSQSYVTDEYLYSVVPPEFVVAVSPAAYQQGSSAIYDDVAKYHPAIALDPEQLVRLNPDLIVVASTARADFSSLIRSTGLPVFRMSTMITSVEQVADTVRLTGYITGADEAAQDTEARVRRAMSEAQAQRPMNAPKFRILGLSGHLIYGGETLFNDIVEKLGAINVGAEGGLKGYTEVSSETILRWDPDWIVTSAEPDKIASVRAQMMADPGIAATQAAKRGHILVLDNRVFFPVSPYSTSLMKAMADALYGEGN